MGVILTHLGHSPLFLPCRPLPENVTVFPVLCSTNYLFIHTPVCSARWLKQLHFVPFMQFAAHVVFKLLYQNLLK